MESQQDIVDLTINDDDDDCLFPTELGETVSSLLEIDGMQVGGIKKLLSKIMKMTL